MEILEATLPYLPGGREIAAKLDARKRTQVLAAMPGLKERAKTLVELVDGMSFLFAERPLALDEKARAVLAQGGAALLAQLLPQLAALSQWKAQAAEAAVRDFAEKTGVKLGQVAQPLRAALTGRLTSPGIFDVLAVLGRDESLARIADQVETARPAIAARR
jgi:glutamyl-tRNA synthetase